MPNEYLIWIKSQIQNYLGFGVWNLGFSRLGFDI